MSYKLSQSLNVFVRRDITYSNKQDKSGQRTGNSNGQPAFNYYGKANAVGLKWSMSDSWTLAAEYHVIHGTNWLAASENRVENMSKKWDLLIAQLIYRF